LSFGSAERLWRHLGVRPGSVCPFAAINDKELAVRVVLDKTMMDADMINVHPLENTRSVAVSPAGLLKFLRETGHEPLVLDLSPAAPDA
jgi:Ala-tRNA(Pro) deacylase